MKKELLVVFLSLILINFFGLINIPNTILLLVVLGMGVLGYSNKRLFKLPMLLFLAGLMFNIISCKHFRGQDYINSFKALPNFLYILFYFGLFYVKPSLRSIEKALYILIITFNGIYIIQFLLLQVGVVFIHSAENSLGDGTSARFRMVGSGLTSLGLFLGLNRYLEKKKLLDLAILGSSALIILLMGFRTMLVIGGLMLFFLMFKLYGMNRKFFRWIFVSILMGGVLFSIPVVQEKIDYMIQKNKTANLDNKSYVRVIEMDYFLNKHFKSDFEMFFGSGMPQVGTDYEKEYSRLPAIGIYYVDWGLWGLSWILGVIPILAMIWYSIKAYKTKVAKRYYYLGIWFVYLVLASITTAEFFRSGNFVIQALALYTIEIASKENKLVMLKQQHIIQQNT